MIDRTDRESAKRRIMFVAGEDFYFLTYTLFVLLTELDATSPSSELSDSRKLSYLADLLSSDSDLHLVTTDTPLSGLSKSRLSLLYDRAVARRFAVERLIHVLERRGLIAVTRSPNEPDRLHLVHSEPVSVLLGNSFYQRERDRVRALKKKIPKLRSMKLDTLKQRIFDDHGVHTWGD